MSIYHHTGEFMLKLRGHADIMALKLDILNKLVISAGHDSITVQTLNSEPLREITPIKTS